MVDQETQNGFPDVNVADIPFAWFEAEVALRSRQVLTTMAKPIALKPYRKRGAWRFRDARGDEALLPAVFQALQQNERGNKWLWDAYTWPACYAEQKRRDRAERRARICGEVEAGFRFLITD